MTPPKKKPITSRVKGKRGELQLAHALGHPAQRGQQWRGGHDSPDAICPSLKAWHIECKLTANCQMFSPAALERWMEQARTDAGGRAPIVIHRWNRAAHWWVLVMPYACPWYWQRLDKFLQVQHYLLKMWEVPR